MSIKKIKLPSDKYFYLGSDDTDRDYRIWVDLTPEYFEIKSYAKQTETKEEELTYWYKVTLDELKLNPGFVEQSLWFINEKEKETDPVINNINLVNAFATTVLHKPLSFTSPLDSYRKTPFCIFVPTTQNATMEDFIYRIAERQGLNVEYTGPSASKVLDESIKYSEFLSNITLSSNSTTVNPDSSITVNVQTDTFIKQVYLEQVSGMLNKTRVNLTNGQGSFKLFATGLESGETLRVKAGFKNFTGVSDFSINVS